MSDTFFQFTNQFSCGCGCGRIVTTRRWHDKTDGPFYASSACRQKAYRKRIRAAKLEALRSTIGKRNVLRSGKRNAKADLKSRYASGSRKGRK